MIAVTIKRLCLADMYDTYVPAGQFYSTMHSCASSHLLLGVFHMACSAYERYAERGRILKFPEGAVLFVAFLFLCDPPGFERPTG